MRWRHALSIIAAAYVSIVLSAGGPVDDATRQAQSLQALVASAKVAISEGRFAQHSGPLADLAYRLKNKAALSDVFETCARSCTAADKYSAFIEYARALSKFNDPAAEQYFRSAIQLQPRSEDAARAYGAYVDYLCGSARCNDASTVLSEIDQHTATQVPRFLMMRLEVTRRLGKADREIEEQARAAGIATFTYAEGYSSIAPDKPMDLAYRVQTVHSRPCEGLRVPVRLEADPETVKLKPGQRFALQDVVLRAYDDSGRFLSQQPVGAMLVFPRNVLEFDSDQHRSFALTARASGNGSGVFTAGCAKNALEAKVTFVVE